MKVILVEPRKPAVVAEIGSGLREMQKVVGGLIEAIYPYDDPVAIVANEEGKLDKLPLNRAMRTEDGEVYDIIAGTFFLTGLSDDDFTSVPDDLVEKYLNTFIKPEAFIQINGIIIVI